MNKNYTEVPEEEEGKALNRLTEWKASGMPSISLEEYMKNNNLKSTHYTEDSWDGDGSKKGWNLHDETCFVYICNPRKIHESGKCDCTCKCGKQEKVETLIRTTIKEHDAGLSKAIECLINDTNMEYIKQKDVLTYQGKPLSTLLGSEKNYVSAEDLDKMLNKVLALFSPEKE